MESSYFDEILIRHFELLWISSIRICGLALFRIEEICSVFGVLTLSYSGDKHILKVLYFNDSSQFGSHLICCINV